MILNKKPFRAVLYDFDGTLADTTDLVLRCYRHTMATHLGVVPPDEEWLRGFGTPLEVQLSQFSRSEAEHAAMVTTYRAVQEEYAGQSLAPFPGAVDCIEALRARGVALAIVTSRWRDSTIRAMSLCGLTDAFGLIVTPEDVARPKPHPDAISFALERLGVHPHEAIFVGDSPHDLAAGRAAGVTTAAALWGPFPHDALYAEKPDHLLHRQADVLELLGD